MHAPRRRTAFRGVAFGIALATLSAGHAFAASPQSQDTARELARALADQGANAYAEEDYAQAALLFARAYELVPAPTIALLEARTLVKLGRLLDATRSYRRASEAKLAPDAPAPFREAARAASAELAALTPRLPRVRVRLAAEIKADPATQLWLDGRRLDARELDAFILVDPGTHRLEVRGADASPPRISFSLAEGQTKVVAVDARPEAGDAQETWGYLSLGAGAVGLVTGVTAGVIALNAHDDAERWCDGGTCAPAGPGRNALERFRTFRAISTTGYVLGALGVGAGVGLLILRDDTSRREVALSASLDEIRVEGRW